MKFISTMEPFPISPSGIAPVMTNATPLFGVNIKDGQASFEPAFHRNKDLGIFSWLSFDDWWSEEILWSPKMVLSRMKLLFTMRTQDGGSHVDD